MTEEIIVKRDIDTVTAEIQALCGVGQRIALEIAIELGRRLVEAKEILPHGEWGKWLKEQVSFSQVTASRYMKLFEEFGSPQGSLFGAETNFSTLKNISVSNALRLLAVPEEERESFAAEHDVAHLSSREMDKLMEELVKEQDKSASLRRERDEAMVERDEAVEAMDGLKEELALMTDRAREETARADANARELDALEAEMAARPVEVAVEKPDPAEVQKQIEAAVKEAEKAFKARQKEMQASLAEAERKKKEAEAEAERQKKTAAEAEKKLLENQAGLESLEKKRLEQEVESLKKELAMADAAVASFRALFEQAQGVMNAMMGALEKVTDKDTRERLCSAVRTLLGVYGEKVAADGTAG